MTWISIISLYLLALHYIHGQLFQEVFQCLLRSFHAAHSLILQEEAQLTTLTAVVVLPVSDKDGETESDLTFVFTLSK